MRGARGGRSGMRARIGIAFAAVAAGAAAAAHAEDGGSLRALRISEENAAELLIGGPDSTAGIGDWYLGNDVVEFAIDDPSRRYGVSPTGGTLIDAGLRDRRDEDQLARLSPMLDLSQNISLGLDAARAEVADGEARIIVSASHGPEITQREHGWFDWLNPLALSADGLRDV